MKLSIFPQYGALNSRPIFDAFATGARKYGHEVVENDQTADMFVIWSVLWSGRMKNNQNLWNLAKKTGKKIIVLEVGGLHRGQTWRVGLNHINNLGTFYHSEIFDRSRPQKLGIFLKSRQTTGKNILICGQHHMSEQWSRRPPPETWLRQTVNTIKKYSDRPIVFRPHPRDTVWVKNIGKLDINVSMPNKVLGTYDDFNHATDFKDAWCVVNPCSNTGIQAAIAGIPIFTDSDSLAYEVSNKNFDKLDNPDLPDRAEWLVKLSHTEWTIQELLEGFPQSQIL